MSDSLTPNVVRARTLELAEGMSRVDATAERAGRLQAGARAAEEQVLAAEEQAAVVEWLVALLRGELIGSELKWLPLVVPLEPACPPLAVVRGCLMAARTILAALASPLTLAGTAQ